MSKQQEKRVLIDYRLARADEALKEAVLLLDAGHYNTTVNRLYYACFYAVNALLLTRGMSSAKHSGVRSLFNQHWVKKNIVPKHLGKFYMEIYEYRQKSDYTDLVSFSQDKILKLLEEARGFVQTIKAIVKETILLPEDGTV